MKREHILYRVFIVGHMCRPICGFMIIILINTHLHHSYHMFLLLDVDFNSPLSGSPTDSAIGSPRYNLARPLVVCSTAADTITILITQ